MPEETAPAFDPAKFVEARNAGKAVERPTPGTPEEKPVLDKEAQEEQTERNLPRHVRREMNKLREEAAFARGQLEAMKSMGTKPEVKETPKIDDPEPKRTDYAEGSDGDAKYQREAGRWDSRQETKRVLATKEESEASTRQIQAAIDKANTNFQKDMETYKDEWDKVLAETADDEDAPKFDPNERPGLTMLLATSEVQMPIWTYLAKNPEQLQKLLALKDQSPEEIQLFRRFEGRSESMYNAKQEVAQASGNTAKEAQNNAHSSEKAGQARAKPRPTADVAARGGSAAPDLPKPGTKEWVMMRNEMYSKKT